MSDNPYRDLPSVNEVLALPSMQLLAKTRSHAMIVAVIRRELADVRRQMKANEATPSQADSEAIATRAAARLELELRPKLRSVINATGIILHTNLGRSPVAEEAAWAAHEAALGYLDLELDLETGKRSTRQSAVREWICCLTGAESATAVNNNAAATIIALRALCQAKEVILSRGQLIEIGGSFRIPEIMAVSGAILREVGTTNITRLADYEQAIGPETAALMQIHSSNYRISGFTKSVSLIDLVQLGKKHNLKVIDDVGSGALIDFARFGFHGEPMARQSIAAGADLVLFSGDKLLGGPQAGILAGRKEWIQKIEKDPLMRAFRLDKMTLAALEATLRIYLDEDRALRTIPVLCMLGIPLAVLRRRSEEAALRIRGFAGIGSAEVREDVAYVGGGTLPDQMLPTCVIEIEAAYVSDADLAQRLRTGTPAVMGRLRGGKLLLDLRTVFLSQEESLLGAIASAVGQPHPEPEHPIDKASPDRSTDLTTGSHRTQ